MNIFSEIIIILSLSPPLNSQLKLVLLLHVVLGVQLVDQLLNSVCVLLVKFEGHRVGLERRLLVAELLVDFPHRDVDGGLLGAQSLQLLAHL